MKGSNDFAPRGEAREPVTKPGCRRCACGEEVAAGQQWVQHIDQCVVRAKKQDAAKSKKTEAPKQEAS